MNAYSGDLNCTGTSNGALDFNTVNGFNDFNAFNRFIGKETFNGS